MKSTTTRRSKSIYAISVLACLILLCVNLGAASLVVTLRSQLLSQVEDESSNIVSLLARQTDHAFQAIDVVHSNIINSFATLGISGADDLRWAGAQRLFHDQLGSHGRTLNFLAWTSIVDKTGMLVSTSKQWPTPSFDFSGRAYFKALAGDSARYHFISEPITYLDAPPMIYVAQRLDDSTGRFMGVVISGVTVQHFESIYQTIALRPNSEILLVRDDGVRLAGSRAITPGAAIETGLIAAPAGSEQAEARPAISFTANASGERTMQATGALEHYPLKVVARVDVGAILQPWWREVLLIGGIVLILNVSVLIAGFLGIRQIRDTNKLSLAEHHSARHDVLTALPNRVQFQERLAEILAGSAKGQPGFGLLLLDLDNFKDVNDTLGHQAGDELLRMVAIRLRQTIGPTDLLARLGGDEFAIVQGDVSSQEEIAALGMRVLAIFNDPFRLRDRQFAIGLSIGAVFGSAGDDPTSLFDRADLALYQAKEQGRGTIRFFSETLNAERRERQSLTQDLRLAIEWERLELYYQPIVDLQSGRLVAFEALLRWHDETRGFVPPTVFIPVAEASGMISPLGGWVLRKATQAAAAWPEPVDVAVNLSAVQLQRSDVFAQVTKALRQSGLASRRLHVEITESVLIDKEGGQEALLKLVSSGVGVSLDDFGTGYSSLSYLRSFPFDRIKIDRSFVQEMASSREASSIVQTVRDLGKRLGMSITAEGIETAEQFTLLRDLGCDCGQGYFIGRPMPSADVADFIRGFQPIRCGAIEQQLALAG